MRTIILVLTGTLLAGCASEPPAGIPGGSALVSESDSVLSFNATESGRVYLRNAKENRLVFSGEIRPGDEVIVTVPTRRIVVGGRSYDLPITPGEHQLYFKGATQREYHPAYNP
jgi:hypothetical protein